MKSIIQEASSLSKAIEQGWEKAGQPIKFTVNILELPEKNFFGLSKKPAKISIFFEEQPAQKPQRTAPQQRGRGREQQGRRPSRPYHRRRRYGSGHQSQPQQQHQSPQNKNDSES